MRVAIFTGSAPGHDARWIDAAVDLTRYLTRQGAGIVYGGAAVGLMGAVADTALAEGAEVIGVIPRDLFDAEVPHQGLTEFHEVDSMHDRKALMADRADAFVALPGGIGTLEEFFEVWTWRTLGLHPKPVALYNPWDFWTPLVSALDAITESGFIRPEVRAGLVVESDPQSLWRALNPPVAEQ
ncbi:TIGR00730 family Rossman fold protein [Demetria terragena]|uniref:LOG family protein n=1 Tax=Demetria terragena TaxID=63959 RepID=UPI000372A15C|nr:TIGR00730 family Rossman fold protein [Demetria terragena]